MESKYIFVLFIKIKILFCLIRYKEKTPDVAKIDWSLIADREDDSNRINKNLLAFYRGLVLLRKENKAFFQTNLDFIHEDHNTKVLAYQRWYENKSVCLISRYSGMPRLPREIFSHLQIFGICDAIR